MSKPTREQFSCNIFSCGVLREFFEKLFRQMIFGPSHDCLALRPFFILPNASLFLKNRPF